MSNMATQLMNMPLLSGEGVDERGSEIIWRIGDGAEVNRGTTGIRGSTQLWLRLDPFGGRRKPAGGGFWLARV